MRRAILAAFVLTNAALAVTPAFASDLKVTLDEVRTITFGAPVATVYVGNPSIADINMIDARHAFVLGKGYGNTNIVALNHDGVQVSNTRISVQADANRQSTVVLNRGTQRVTYDCTANHCEVTPQPGDGATSFEAASGQINQHEDTAKKAASAQ